MIAYHGTDANFSKFDFRKSASTETGVCFTPDFEIAKSYGENIHEVELNFSKLLDLTSKIDALKIIELCSELKKVIENEEDASVDEIVEDDFSIFTEIIQDEGRLTESGLKIALNCIDDLKSSDYMRFDILKAAAKAGYDCVRIEDCTDYDHDTYIALNAEIIADCAA